MKTVFAAHFVTAFASILPAVATEAVPVLRRSDDTVIGSSLGKEPKVKATIVETAPPKKIRVVLASPYGN